MLKYIRYKMEKLKFPLYLTMMLCGFTLTTERPLTLNETVVGSLGALTNSFATPSEYTGVVTFVAAVGVVGKGGAIYSAIL